MPNDTLVKLSSRLPKASSLDGHADKFHDDLGGHYMALVEFRVADRTEVDPDSDAHPRAKLEVTAIEVAYDPEDSAGLRTRMTGEVVREATDTSVPTPITGKRGARG